MRIFRWLFLFLLCFLVTAAGTVVWIRSAAGAKAVSGWLTGRLQPSAPGTRVDLQGLVPQWPASLKADRAVWNGPDGKPILVLEPLCVGVNRAGWKADGRVIQLDLAQLDRTAARGEWKADGILRGNVRVRGRGGRLDSLDLKLQSEPPGANLNSKILEQLAERMPPGDARRILLKALGGPKATFHFDVGKAELSAQGGQYVLGLLLDGDHLLDLTIRIPRDSLELLKETNRWK